MLTTIGYEGAELADFLATLKLCDVQVLIDIRERAQSRRRGFSKSALAAALAEIDIEYLHLRQLGDPKEGRDAARAGDYEHFGAVFREVMASKAGRQAFNDLKAHVAMKSVCLMCYERDQNHCHRKIVADKLEDELVIRARHLGVKKGAGRISRGRVRDIDQGPAASI